MLIAGSRLIDAPVMGLQTGSELARISDAIINPQTLAVIAYELTGKLLDLHPSVLRIDDVREFSDIGVIVDSSDEFVTPRDIVKLDEIYNLHFKPIGMSVIDEKRHKIGKVVGYTIETAGFVIQQLTVKRPLLKSITETELLIHRTQITEINNDAIIVHPEAKIPEPVMQSVRNVYNNPFRKGNTQAEHVDRE